MTIYTVGHSTLALADFLQLVRDAGIEGIADVRRFPASRRHPHFGRDALAAALAQAGIDYAWLPDLGGRRRGRPDSPHVAWRNESFRAYADHMETAEFRAAITQLVGLAEERATAILCAEAVPWRCHRQLIADALVSRGILVVHVVSGRRPEPHRLTPFARVDGEHLLYDGGQMALS